MSDIPAEKLVEGNAVVQLEEVSNSQILKFFELPSGNRVVVAPDDGFETLGLAFRDPHFITSLASSLARAVDDVKEDRIEAFDESLLGANSNGKSRQDFAAADLPESEWPTFDDPNMIESLRRTIQDLAQGRVEAFDERLLNAGSDEKNSIHAEPDRKIA